jgi:hypothetical protein
MDGLQIRITRCIVIGQLSKQQQDISGKRANVWGVSEWPYLIKFVQFCCEISIGFAVPHSTVPLIPGWLISGDLSPGIYIRGLIPGTFPWGLIPGDLFPGTYSRGLIPGEQPPLISRFQAFQTWHHCKTACSALTTHDDFI